ncbi:MAG: hypothetical protein COU10_01460 [Candidatus Harrisonbacteria bacterium CG10_big_fil_rev_8_21_14_0_10_45_28]|uniref:30S ribosomal protein S6 n=1 Tax=Candidatus Harrisonbacteria bacterium CG10_big_fil_rev_8_21_14_0_10_45_28 TaxID=1974586 RepID=A0A2H0UNL3_9BACT|nr:MAG: hypothetical protein COU10_01460 [Candidatus Harrisonbacteria bacterium CG10_big_fil_rev_8_21_14_0_10_45_28]
MENQENNKALYELAYLLPIGKDDAELKAILEKYGFKIVRAVASKEIKLAYTIEKQDVASFGYCILELAKDMEGYAEAVDKTTQALNLEKDILRFLFMKYEEVKKREPMSDADKAKRGKKEEIMPEVDRMDSISNEKLEETLEEILR